MLTTVLIFLWEGWGGGMGKRWKGGVVVGPIAKPSQGPDAIPEGGGGGGDGEGEGVEGGVVVGPIAKPLQCPDAIPEGWRPKNLWPRRKQNGKSLITHSKISKTRPVTLLPICLERAQNVELDSYCLFIGQYVASHKMPVARIISSPCTVHSIFFLIALCWRLIPWLHFWIHRNINNDSSMTTILSRGHTRSPVENK